MKALLWPVIRNDADFDYITEQGFWVCFTVAVLTLVVSVFTRSFLAGSFDAAFYFLAGLGVRQRSKIAAFSAFAAYLLGSLALQRLTGHGFGLPRIVFLALLLSNIRGIWLSTRWKGTPEADEGRIRLNETLFDKLSDQLPAIIWPRLKWLFPFLMAIEIAETVMLLTTPRPPAALPLR